MWAMSKSAGCFLGQFGDIAEVVGVARVIDIAGKANDARERGGPLGGCLTPEQRSVRNPGESTTENWSGAR
jgi:hypothetical protein